jgi:hypothetical protein
MTAVNFYSVTVSADAPSALGRLVRQFDARGWMPRAHSLPGRRDGFSDVEDPCAEALASEFTGASVARSGAADSESHTAVVSAGRVRPVALSCLVLSQVASCRLRRSSPSR